MQHTPVTARQSKHSQAAGLCLSHSSGREGSSILSYSSITEDKLDLFLQNPICFPFPLLPSHPDHVAVEEKRAAFMDMSNLKASFIQALKSKEDTPNLCALGHALCQN